MAVNGFFFNRTDNLNFLMNTTYNLILRVQIWHYSGKRQPIFFEPRILKAEKTQRLLI